MMSMLLDFIVWFLECVLSSGPTVETVEIFSSPLVSNLLPNYYTSFSFTTTQGIVSVYPSVHL